MEGDIAIAVIITINVTISLVGVIGNGFVIIAFISNRRLRTQSNYFMISLVVLSFIHCAVFYPIQALMDIGVIVGQSVCFPIGCLGLTESVAITLCLLATSTERYIAICWPLSADTILTPNRIIVTFVVMAAYSIISGIVFPSLTWIGHEGEAFSDKQSRCTLVSISPTIGYAVWMGVNWLAPIPIMFMIYCRIFFIVRRHIREINAQMPQLNTISERCEAKSKVHRVGRNKVHPRLEQVSEADENKVNELNDGHSLKNDRDQISSKVMQQEHSAQLSSMGENRARVISQNGVHDPNVAEEHIGNLNNHRYGEGITDTETTCRPSLKEGRANSSMGQNGPARGPSESQEPSREPAYRDDRVSTTNSRGVAGMISTAGNDGKHVAPKHRRSRWFNRETKSAFVVFAIVVLYSFNFIPYVVYLFTNVVSSTPDFDRFAIIHAILFANYALNPYIYGFGNRNVRHTIRNMVFRRRREGRLGGLHSVSETVS